MSLTHTDGSFLHSDITDQIIGAFFYTYDGMGFGFLESNYKEGLAIVLSERGLFAAREVPVIVNFLGRRVGSYRMDMVVNDKVVVEVKSTLATGPTDERQLLNYLRATKYEVGLLLHFGPKPKVRRMYFTNDRKQNGTNNQ